MARRPFFSGNYGSALGSYDTAAKLIAQAGQAQGQMYANLGKIAVESINKYAENKQKKEEEKQASSFIENYLKDKPEMAAQFGIKGSDLVSFEEAVKQGASAIAKNPKGMETVKGLISMEQERVKAQEASQVRNLQMQQIQQSMDNQQADRLRADQNRISENQFMQSLMSQTASPQAQRQADIARPGLAVLGNGDARNRFMQAQLQQPQNQVPVSSLGSQDFGRFASKEGLDPKLSVTRMEALRQAEVASQPKAPDPFKVRDELRKTTEFEQGQDAITFTPERNTIVLGDTVYGISGKFGNEAEVIKLKSVEIPNYSNMNSVMNQLISLGEKRKTTKFMSNADKTLAQSLSNQLRGLLREQILGPGTVTDPERAILNEIVQNPTTWMDTAGNTQSKIDSLKGIRKDAFNKLKTRLTGLGLNVAEIGQGGASSSSKSSVNFDQETPSGLGYTEINLDQL